MLRRLGSVAEIGPQSRPGSYGYDQTPMRPPEVAVQ
jgi:hypothetical protein